LNIRILTNALQGFYMLRINLLPAYVAQRRRTRSVLVLESIVSAVIIAAMLGLEFGYLKPQDTNEQQLAATAAAASANIATLTGDASKIASSAGPIQANIDYVNSVYAYNLVYPTLFEHVAKYTSPRILYSGMQMNGANLEIQAYTPSLEELGRYMEIMYQDPDFTSVSISAVPTPAEAAERVYLYKGVVVGTAGAKISALAAPETIPGVPAGVNVQLPAGVTLTQPGMTANGSQAQSAMGRGGFPGGLPAMPAGMSQAQEQMMARRYGSTAAAQAPTNVWEFIADTPNFNYKYFKVKVHKTDGFPFVVSCALAASNIKSPPTPPGGATPVTGPGG
jgi:Tfp pilus assembly protein PilN